MTPESFLDQIMSAVRRALPRWVPRSVFDDFLRANRAQLVARIARSPKFSSCSTCSHTPRALPMSRALAAGAAEELLEHPWAGPDMAARIAADHLRKKPGYYGKAANVPAPRVIETSAVEVARLPKLRALPAAKPEASTGPAPLYAAISSSLGDKGKHTGLWAIARTREQALEGAMQRGVRREALRAVEVGPVLADVLLRRGGSLVTVVWAFDKNGRAEFTKKGQAANLKIAKDEAAKAAKPNKAATARPTSAAPSFFNVPFVDSPDLDATVDSRALKTAVKLVRKVAKSGPVCILAAGGSLYLVASAEEQWFTAKVPGRVAQQGRAWFTGGDLGSLSAAAGSVLVRVDNRRLSVNGNFAAVSSETPGTGLPEYVRERGDDVVWSAAELRQAFETVEPFVSRDPSRVNLHSALMDPRLSSGAAFVGTDGHRLTRYEAELPTPAHQFLWPLAVLGAASTVLAEAGQVRLSLDNDRGQGLARTAMLAGDRDDVAWMWIIGGAIVVFPPYERVIPKSFDLSCSIDGTVAKAAIEPLVKLAKAEKAKMPSTTWVFTATTLDIQYRAVGLGEEMRVEIPLACRVPKDKQGTTVGLNIFYMNEVLSLPAFRGPLKVGADLPTKDPKQVAEPSSLNPVRIDASGAGWAATAVVMPTRL